MTEALCGTTTRVAGPFKGYWGGTAEGYYLGMTSEDGFEIERVPAVEEVTSSEQGQEVIDLINQGVNCFVSATFIEFYQPAVRELLKLYADVEGRVAPIGCALRTQAVPLYLQNATGFANQPVTYYFKETIWDPGLSLRFALTSRLRVLPARFRCFSFDVNGEMHNYTVTWPT